MSSGLRTALPGVLIALCLSVLAWFGWQSLKMDSILDEGYFVSVDLAFKPADHLEYERFTYGDDPREFAEPLRFVHWKDGSLNYDGERSVEINYDGQALRHPSTNNHTRSGAPVSGRPLASRAINYSTLKTTPCALEYWS